MNEEDALQRVPGRSLRAIAAVGRRLAVDRIDIPDFPGRAGLSATRVNLSRPGAAAERGGKAKKAGADQRARPCPRSWRNLQFDRRERKVKEGLRAFYRKQWAKRKAAQVESGPLPASCPFCRLRSRRLRRSNALTDRPPPPVLARRSGFALPMPSRLGEADLIARYFAPLAGPAGLGLRDDAALMRPPPGEDLVLTTDALVAGVHFFADDPPRAIARKALRVNLSDLAAKAARPLGFLLALALPSDWSDEWLAAFVDGSRRRRHGLQMPASRRRHRRDAGAADAERDRDRRGCARANAQADGRQARRSPLCHVARLATPRSASRFGWGGGLT